MHDVFGSCCVWCMLGLVHVVMVYDVSGICYVWCMYAVFGLLSYFNPSHEYSNCNCIVELCLPIRQELKVDISVGFTQQLLQLVADR